MDEAWGATDGPMAAKIGGDEDNFLTQFYQEFGYYDLLLMTPDGHCFHTVCRESDYGTNLVDGKFSDSNLGRLVREVLDSKKFGFADYQRYAPCLNEPAAFIAEPVIGPDGNVELVVALQLAPVHISEIVGLRADMGESGDTVVVGPDKLMRSDSLRDPKRRSVVASFAGSVESNGIDTETVREALRGNSGAKVIRGFDGDMVLSAYAPVEVYGATWALLVEIDVAEAR